MKCKYLIFLAGCIILFSGYSQTRDITKITGDLYRFRNDAHYSVFLVTSGGVIATDPISKEAATWLKAEIEKRFNQPIKYLVYSHDHADHISGGEVFDEANVIAHELTKENIIKEKRPTAVPDGTFSDRMTIELGGKTIELIYPGKSHSDNCIAIYFPDEKTVFAVDFISTKRLPYRTLNNAFFPDWMQAIEKVEALDFDIFVPGHGDIGNKKDVRDHRLYLEELYSEVTKARKKGMSVDEMKQVITLDKYKHFGQYEAWREMNIEGMAKYVKE